MRPFDEGILCEESGQSMVEYGLIIFLVAIVIIIGLSEFGEKNLSLVSGVGDMLMLGK